MYTLPRRGRQHRRQGSACASRCSAASQRRVRRPGRRHHRQRQEGDPRRRREAGRRGQGASSSGPARPTRRDDGSYVRFDRNALVLIDNDNEPARHPHLRGRRPRAARPAVHEDRQPGRRGGLDPARRLALARAEPSCTSAKTTMVEVIAGDDKGTAAPQGAARPAREEQGRGRGRQPGLQAPEAQPPQPAGRPALEGDADRRLQRHALSARPCNRGVRVGHRVHRRRPEGALLQEVRRPAWASSKPGPKHAQAKAADRAARPASARPPSAYGTESGRAATPMKDEPPWPGCSTSTTTKIVPALAKKFGRDEQAASLPKLREDRHQHGRRQGAAGQEPLLEAAVEQPGADQPARSRRSPRPRSSVSRLPPPRGQRDRLPGHAPRPADVRVPRPADQRSPCRVSATSAASTRRASTATATTAWA